MVGLRKDLWKIAACEIKAKKVRIIVAFCICKYYTISKFRVLLIPKKKIEEEISESFGISMNISYSEAQLHERFALFKTRRYTNKNFENKI
jgi:hypothetical protein